MDYRQLGQTDLNVSRIGFGAAPLGNVYGNLTEGEGIRAVHTAIDQGVNFFDTSPLYGDTLSEERLGKALHGRRDQVILATKAGHYANAPFDFSPQGIRTSLEESLKRLQTDVLDLFQLHDIEYGDLEQIIQEAVHTLVQLREAGKVRYIGITGYRLDVLRKTIEQCPELDTMLSFARYTLLDTTLSDDFLRFAKDYQVGLINASPIHMGVLTEAPPPTWREIPSQVQVCLADAISIARSYDTNISHLALQFALSHPDLPVTVVGMRTPAEVLENVSLLQAPIPLDALQAVQNALLPVHNLAWSSL